MKASLNTYISNLSDNKLDILKEIILNKYKKFIKFYWLIKPYSDDIINMKYNFSDQNTLDTEVTFNKNIDTTIIESDLNESDYIVHCEIEKNKMKLTIIYDE